MEKRVTKEMECFLCTGNEKEVREIAERLLEGEK